MTTKQTLEIILRTLEMQLLDPDVRIDRRQTAILIADDFIEFGSSGRIFGKTEVIESLSRERGGPRIVRRLRGFKIRCPAADVALATYVAERCVPGQPILSTLRSSVWCRRNGRWVLTFHQGTPVASGSDAMVDLMP